MYLTISRLIPNALSPNPTIKGGNTMSKEWPPVGTIITTDEVLPADVVATPLSQVMSYQSKSPMKYAIDYVAVDVDGNVIEDTDYFIVKSDAWARARQLYDDANDVRTVTFREL